MGVYKLTHKVALQNCITEIREAELDGMTEVVVRPVKKDKTRAQLGGIFGAWITHIAEERCESEDFIHKELKAKFLARIYFTNPECLEQENWVDHCVLLQELRRLDELKAYAERISLSWASLQQVSKYMKAIEQHYQAEGMPLPVLDKFRNTYSRWVK